MMFRLPHTRALVLGGALLVTVVASVWPRSQETPSAEAVVPATPREAAPKREEALPVASESPTLDVRRGRPPAPEVRDIFDARTWNPPPTTRPQRAPPPPPPTAPPFPYSVSGSVVDGQGVMIVFTNQQQNFVVRVGEVLEQTYRVEAVDPQSVTVTYLPLGLTQRVPMAGVN